MSNKNIRYGQYLGAVRRHHRHISYSEVISAERSLPSRRATLRPLDIHRLVTPYVTVRFAEQMRSVIPLALMLVGFQALALRTTPEEAEMIALGISAVMIGCLLYTSPSPRDRTRSRMPSSA